jgi:hypothetical protein
MIGVMCGSAGTAVRCGRLSGPGTSDECLSEEVHQATGMICAQAGCDVSEALGRLRVRADAVGHTLHDTAVYVIDNVIRFDE